LGKLGSSKISTKWMMNVPKVVRTFLNTKIGDSFEFYTADHDFKDEEVPDCLIVKVKRDQKNEAQK
jgi:bifunctional DNA-binding transcriptional regulator/antitoxin component of YhaV-PrlF toxin-antitoxin module